MHKYFPVCSDFRIINEVFGPFKSSVNADCEMKLSEIPQGERMKFGQSQKCRCVVPRSDFSTNPYPTIQNNFIYYNPFGGAKLSKENSNF